MRVIRILFCFAGMLAVGMALVALRAETRQTGHLISRRLAEQQTLRRSCFDLELEMARLMSPIRLDAESRRLELGFCPAGTLADDAGFIRQAEH